MAFNKRGKIIVASAAAMAVANEAAKSMFEDTDTDSDVNLNKTRIDEVIMDYVEVKPQARHPKHRTHPKRVGKHNR